MPRLFLGLERDGQPEVASAVQPERARRPRRCVPLVPPAPLPSTNLADSPLLPRAGGTEDPIDIDDLRAHTVYSGWSADENTPTIRAFWDVVSSFGKEDRAKLVRFVTACERPPLLGFGQLNPLFAIRKAGDNQSRLPTRCVRSSLSLSLCSAPRKADVFLRSATCINLLRLEEYADPDNLREKLLCASSLLPLLPLPLGSTSLSLADALLSTHADTLHAPLQMPSTREPASTSRERPRLERFPPNLSRSVAHCLCTDFALPTLSRSPHASRRTDSLCKSGAQRERALSAAEARSRRSRTSPRASSALSLLAVTSVLYVCCSRATGARCTSSRTWPGSARARRSSSSAANPRSTSLLASPAATFSFRTSRAPTTQRAARSRQSRLASPAATSRQTPTWPRLPAQPPLASLIRRDLDASSSSAHGRSPGSRGETMTRVWRTA